MHCIYIVYYLFPFFSFHMIIHFVVINISTLQWYVSIINFNHFNKDLLLFSIYF